MSCVWCHVFDVCVCSLWMPTHIRYLRIHRQLYFYSHLSSCKLAMLTFLSQKIMYVHHYTNVNINVNIIESKTINWKYCSAYWICHTLISSYFKPTEAIILFLYLLCQKCKRKAVIPHTFPSEVSKPTTYLVIKQQCDPDVLQNRVTKNIYSCKHYMPNKLLGFF